MERPLVTESPKNTLSAKKAASSKGIGGCVGSVAGTVGTVVGIVGKTVGIVVGAVGTVVGTVGTTDVAGTTGAVGKDGIVGSVDVPVIIVAEDPKREDVDMPGKVVGRNTEEWKLLPVPGAGEAPAGCSAINTTTAHIHISKKQEIHISKINRLFDPEADMDMIITPL